MKNKAKELDVDFIGGHGPLTKDEEQQISEFIKPKKLLKAKKQIYQFSLFIICTLLLIIVMNA